jgi:drug/metabolite transporter (DMT)-like permease
VTPAIAYSTVAVSSFSHAYWNYLFKRSGGGQTFVALSKCAEAALLTPVFIIIGRASGIDLITHWPLSIVGSAFVLANYVTLARAYDSGALSVVYPVSRGAILLFLPVLGFFMFRERLSLAGSAALVIVVAGIAAVALPALSWAAVRDTLAWKRGGVSFALLAAFSAALYTAWSKLAMGALPAFAYFYAYTLLTAIALLVMARQDIGEPMRTVWRGHWWAIVRVAVLNSGTFMLVLLALREATSSYVIAVRQLSIVWSIMLGRYALEEKVTTPQKVGVVLLLAGCGLITFA